MTIPLMRFWRRSSQSAAALTLCLCAAIVLPTSDSFAQERPSPLPAPLQSGEDAGITRSVVMTGASPQGQGYSLERLLEIARSSSPLLATSRSEELVQRAGITTARAYPNPELELAAGHAGGRAGSLSGAAPLISISQALENPRLRATRQQTAQARLQIAESQTAQAQVTVVAEVRRAFLDVARAKEELRAFQEDLRLADQIRQRIQVRVRTGEAPRFDLIRAETEVAVSRKNADSAQLKLRFALAVLRQAVGPLLPVEFDIAPDSVEVERLTEDDYQSWRSRLLDANPDVGIARRELERAQRQIELERAQVMPQVTLRATQDRDPSVTINRIGAMVQIPILNRREGPIAEAQAQAERARLLIEQREFEATASFESAWRAYTIATGQLSALENGIVERSRVVVEVAEAAYRFGERGILEFLDAQRQFRLVRNELIQARFSARQARVELERLAGMR